MKNIDVWLRKEAENLTVEIDNVEKKITKEFEKGNFDKINELNIQRREFKAQQFKLYEMIGRLNELND